jgi:hypothetical protein
MDGVAKMQPADRGDLFSETAAQRGEFNPAVAEFVYPPGIRTADWSSTHVRPFVRLEMGARAEHWPAKNQLIKPYAADVFPQILQHPECEVRTLAAERTFWEKATLLHEECHRPLRDPMRARHSRHYYDLAKLFRHPIGLNALKQLDLLRAVVSHKKLFFGRGWSNFDAALAGGFRLLPPDERLSTLRTDYRTMQEEMIFGESPSFDELLEVVSELQDRLNRLTTPHSPPA